MAQRGLPENGQQTVTMKTNMGDIKIKLFPEHAPKAVENFVTHAKNGYYDGIIFHRVINDFMIQCGDPTGTGRGGESIWGAPFKDEFTPELHNIRGALSMANAGPGTNGSQFFIVQKTDAGAEMISQMAMMPESFPEECVEDYKEVGGTPWLDYRHTVFGQVYEGMDVVDNIATAAVDAMDKPFEKIFIETIIVD